MLSNTQNHRTQNDVRNWVMQLPYEQAIALTFTFPPIITSSRTTVEKHMRYFWNVVDKKVFGKRSSRSKPYRCPRLMFLEHGRNRDNFHFHGILGVPTNDHANAQYQNLNGMGLLLNDTWYRDMTFNAKRAYVPAQIEPIKTTHNYSLEQWVGYITKTISDSNWDALCLETSWGHNGPPQ